SRSWIFSGHNGARNSPGVLFFELGLGPLQLLPCGRAAEDAFSPRPWMSNSKMICSASHLTYNLNTGRSWNQRTGETSKASIVLNPVPVQRTAVIIPRKPKINGGVHVSPQRSAVM